ncbi:MAG: DUF2924 domain-containing protein, partial [Candidatus Korobacteraceae bacterium]
MANSLATQIDSLSKTDNDALSALWQKLFQSAPPDELRRALMVRILAYRIQEQAFRGLSPGARQRLRQMARALEKNPGAAISAAPGFKPGTRLIRQWRGHTHVVTVKAKGYEYQGSLYQSLSEIARLITGTRWSGPLFFG